MSQSPRVLVTGATGAIGPVVVETFLQAGYRVRTFARTVRAAGLLSPVVEQCSGDITEHQRVQAAMEGVDLVIHLAALLHVVNPEPEMRPLYQRVNVEGTQTVIAGAQQAGVKRLIFSSTIAVYGTHQGHLLTEADPPQPDTLYGETKMAAETLVLQAKRLNGEPLGVVLRLASTYGAHVKGNYRRLLQSLARGSFIPIGVGDNRRTLIYERDVARALLLAATHPKAAGQTFNLTDGHCHTMREIIDTISNALGRKPPGIHLPVGPVRTLAEWLEAGTRAAGLHSSIGRATIDKYVEDIQVSGQRIQDVLGFSPQYDLAVGWQETIQAMRVAGEL